MNSCSEFLLDGADTTTMSRSTRNVDECVSTWHQFGDYLLVPVLFSHVSIMANNIMSMSWSVTNSLMVKVLFLTDRTLMIAAKRVLFAHI